MGSLRRSASNLPPALIAGACILLPLIFVAAFPGLLAPYSPDTIVGIPLSGPSAANLLGTDEIGRDILSRVIYGARSDVVVSFSAATIAFVVGSLIGILLGYRGGIAETTGMRVVDIFLAFPAIVLSLFLITIFGHGELLEIFAIAVVMTPSMARFARGTSVVLRNRAYIDASRILRARDRYVVRRHLFPNALRTLLVAGSVLGAGAVLIAASLSYLGLGPPAANAQLGQPSSTARSRTSSRLRSTVSCQASASPFWPTGICCSARGWASFRGGRGGTRPCSRHQSSAYDRDIRYRHEECRCVGGPP